MTPDLPFSINILITTAWIYVAVIVLILATVALGIAGGLLLMFRERPEVRGIDRLPVGAASEAMAGDDAKELRRLARILSRKQEVTNGTK